MKPKSKRKPKFVVEDHDQKWGAAAIGKVINKPERAAFHLLEEGKLPAQKIGGMWTASSRKLLAFLSGEAE
jgi:hypothetical protein